MAKNWYHKPVKDHLRIHLRYKKYLLNPTYRLSMMNNFRAINVKGGYNNNNELNFMQEGVAQKI